MDFSLHLVPNARRMEDVAVYNAISERFGLALTQTQLVALEAQRQEALADTGRVEFGAGILQKLVFAFCDSPFIESSQYSETLAALQTLFYTLKNANARLSDDEVLEKMCAVFNGRAKGSIEYLQGVLYEEFLSGEGAAPEPDSFALCPFEREDNDAE